MSVGGFVRTTDSHFNLRVSRKAVLGRPWSPSREAVEASPQSCTHPPGLFSPGLHFTSPWASACLSPVSISLSPCLCLDAVSASPSSPFPYVSVSLFFLPRLCQTPSLSRTGISLQLPVPFFLCAGSAPPHITLLLPHPCLSCNPVAKVCSTVALKIPMATHAQR